MPRRAGVYNAIRQYVAHIVYSGKYEQPGYDLFEAFADAVETSRFLFSNKLHLEVKALDAFVDGFLGHAKYASDRSLFPSEDDWEAARAEVDRRAIELRRRFQSLPTLFEPEMSLKVRQASIDAYVSSTETDDQPADKIGRSLNRE